MRVNCFSAGIRQQCGLRVREMKNILLVNTFTVHCRGINICSLKYVGNHSSLLAVKKNAYKNRVPIIVFGRMHRVHRVSKTIIISFRVHTRYIKHHNKIYI